MRDPLRGYFVLNIGIAFASIRRTMYTWPMTSHELTQSRDIVVAAADIDASRSTQHAMDDIMEFPLLLSRLQVAKLAHLAEGQGMTSAQFLRRCINSFSCES